MPNVPAPATSALKTTPGRPIRRATARAHRTRPGAQGERTGEHHGGLVRALDPHGFAEHARELEQHPELRHGHNGKIGAWHEEQRAGGKVGHGRRPHHPHGGRDAHEGEVRGKGGVFVGAIQDPARKR